MIALSTIAIPDGAPTEFRVFRAGENETTKGTFIFDAASAASVMAAYQKHAVDMMIDLEHLSLDTESVSYDPDARGWCKLELRNGELWAVDVRWTPEGTARLANRTQRYISPVFDVDSKGKIARVFNIAMCAMPATDDAMALVAATERVRSEAEQQKETKMLNEADSKLASDVSAALQALADGAEDPGLKQAAIHCAQMLADIAAGKPSEEAQPESVPATEAVTAALTERDVATVKLAEVTKQRDALAAEIAKLAEDRAKQDFDTMIASNRAKLTPALESWCRTQSPDVVRAFLSAAPVVRKEEAKAPIAKSPVESVDLNDEEKFITLAFGRSVKEFTNYKTAKLAAKGDK